MAKFFVSPVLGQETNIDCTAAINYTVQVGEEKNLSSFFAGGVLPNTISGKVFLIKENGKLIIDKSAFFVNCRFRSEENASVRTKTNPTSEIVFRAVNCRFYTCEDMWQGITINNKSRITFEWCFIRDANSGITFGDKYNGITNVLRSNYFQDNRVGMRSGVGFTTTTVNFTTCSGNVFEKVNISLKDGTQASAGVIVNQKSNFTFGTPPSVNIIRNLPMGMIIGNDANALIRHTQFLNCRVNPTLAISGYGIYSENGNFTVGIEPTPGTPTLAWGKCIFDNNELAGIYIRGTSAYSNVFGAELLNRQQFGIQMVPSFKHTGRFRIENNTFKLHETDSRMAISIQRPSLSDPKSTINDNFFEIRELPGVQQNLLAIQSFVEIVGAVGANNTLDVQRNRIFNYSRDSKIHGIFSRGDGNKVNIFDNRIRYWTPLNWLDGNHDFGSFGIAFEAMDGGGNQILLNDIRARVASPDADPFAMNKSFIQCGIHVVDCNQPLVCQNFVDSTHRGFHFGEENPLTVFGLNTTVRHVHGTYFGTDVTGMPATDIGNQVLRGNVWTTNAANIFGAGVGAICREQGVTLTTPPPFGFRVSYTNGLGHVPLTALPNRNTWFIDDQGTILPCVLGDPLGWSRIAGQKSILTLSHVKNKRRIAAGGASANNPNQKTSKKI